MQRDMVLTQKATQELRPPLAETSMLFELGFSPSTCWGMRVINRGVESHAVLWWCEPALSLEPVHLLPLASHSLCILGSSPSDTRNHCAQRAPSRV